MNWVVVVAPALASGVLGSIVTTYGTQAKERRAARTDVRTKLQVTEQLGRHQFSPEGRAELVSALNQLEDAALTAALPHYLIRFYRHLRLLAYETRPTAGSSTTYNSRSEWVISRRLATSTAALIVQSLWHPWLSGLIRWRRMYRLGRILRNGLPGEASKILEERDEDRAWERSLLRGSRSRGSLPRGKAKDA